MRLLGTVRLNLVSKPAVKASIERVDASERGRWELVGEVRLEPGWMEKQKKHPTNQRRLPKAQRTTYEPVIVQAEKAGYVIYKDKGYLLYQRTPSQPTLPSTYPEAVLCCHGTYPIQRWTEDRMMHRRVFMAPTIIAAYNFCMNAVDRVDQLRSINPIRRREKRLSMTMFTWLMDIAIINAHTLVKTIRRQERNKFAGIRV
ncbi:hypothetical protein F444_17356 [Phytophthora nicotianae P1976]|nr:hypothetical protein F444_17356 [Phytophthora nicotianae P1976]